MLGGWLSRTVAGAVPAIGPPIAERSYPVLPSTHGGLTIVAAGVLGLVIVVVALTSSVTNPVQWLIVTIGSVLSVRFVLTAIQAERLLAGSVARQIRERLEAARRARIALGDRPTLAVLTAIAEVLEVEDVGFAAPAEEPSSHRDGHEIRLPVHAAPDAAPDGDRTALTFRSTPRTTTDRFRFNARLAAARPWIVEVAAAAVTAEPGWRRERLIAATLRWRMDDGEAPPRWPTGWTRCARATAARSITLDRVDLTTGEPSRIGSSGDRAPIDEDGATNEAPDGAVTIRGGRPVADDRLDLAIRWGPDGIRLDEADAAALIDIVLAGLLPALPPSAPAGPPTTATGSRSHRCSLPPTPPPRSTGWWRQ